MWPPLKKVDFSVLAERTYAIIYVAKQHNPLLGGSVDDMAKGTGDGGVGPDAIFTAIMRQLDGIGHRVDGLGGEIGSLRTEQGKVAAKVDTTNEIVTRLEAKVKDIDEDLHGNGQPGIVTRMTTAETKIRTLQTVADPGRQPTALGMESITISTKLLAFLKSAMIHSWKIAIVVMLLRYGYVDLVKPFLGIPSVQTPTPVVAPEDPSKTKEKVRKY